MTNLIFDGIITVLLILAVIQGYRKGFVLTLCGFLAIFVAFLGATFLSNALAEPVSQAIRPAIEQSVAQSMRDSLEEQGWSLPDTSDASADPSGSAQSGDFAFEDQLSLDQVLTLLQDSKLFQGFSDAIHSAVSQGVLEVTTSAAQAVAGYLALEVARTVLFFLCFLLVLMGWFLLSRALDLAFRLPVLSALNRWSGAALGLVKGVVLVFIACWLLRGLFPQEAVDQSVLFHFFCTANPFGGSGLA